MIKEPVPLIILFRALGCISDKEILTRICFGAPSDVELMETLRPSLEEAKLIQD